MQIEQLLKFKLMKSIVCKKVVRISVHTSLSVLLAGQFLLREEGKEMRGAYERGGQLIKSLNLQLGAY